LNNSTWTKGHPGFDLIRKTESELPTLRFDHPNGEARIATGIDKAFTAEKLKPFAQLKTWAK